MSNYDDILTLNALSPQARGGFAECRLSKQSPQELDSESFYKIRDLSIAKSYTGSELIAMNYTKLGGSLLLIKSTIPREGYRLN